jgi:hypothetical protein
MLNKLRKKVEADYFKHNQILYLESMHIDDGELTEQFVCLTNTVPTYADKLGFSWHHCIFCIHIRSFKDLETEWAWTPYYIFDPEYKTFEITVPHFNYLSKEDICNAIHYVVRKNFWLIFNIKVDGQTI